MSTNAIIEKPVPVIAHANPQLIERAPEAAFQFAAPSPFQFAAADAGDAGQSAAFTMLARTGAPVEHWYWGLIVHDFAGMVHRERIPVDYMHRVEDPIGYADKFDASSGNLVIGGSVESIEAMDDAAKLIERARRKIPYQGSIHFCPYSLVLEWLPEGMTTEVNGQQVAGPLVIARQWTLRGVAICPHGHDVGSECEIDAATAFSLTWKGSPMSKDSTPATAPAAAGQLAATVPATTPTAAPVAAGQLAATTPAAAPAGTPGVDTASDPRAQFAAEQRAEFARFKTKFGEQGAEYWAAGLDYAAACEQHIGKLSADLTTERELRVAAETKVSAAQLKHGEPAHVDNAGASTTAKSSVSLFRPAAAA